MIAVFALVTAVFAAAALLLLIVAVGLFAESELLSGALGAGFASLAAYGAYLFGRSAWRTRHHPRGRILLLLPAVAFAVLTAVRVPGELPTGVRVIFGIGAFIATAVAFAVMFEPSQRRPRR